MIEQMTSGPLLASLALALVGGLLSFVSPCVLPLVPAYLGHLVGTNLRRDAPPSRRGLLLHALAFVVGFALVFTVAGLAVGLLLETLQVGLTVVRIVGGVAVIVVGLHTAGVITVPLLYRQAKLDDRSVKTGSVAGSFAIGMIFAAGWSPCIGSILTGIFGLAATQPAWAGVLFFTYSIGLGVPFILAALLLGRYDGWLRALNKHARAIAITSGAFLVLVGLLLITDTFALLAIIAPPIEPFGQ